MINFAPIKIMSYCNNNTLMPIQKTWDDYIKERN